MERRLLRVNVDTGTTSDVPALDFGNLVAWSPGRSILIQSEDAHGYWILDPDSAGQRPLLPEHDRGYLWQLEVSPGGDRVAVLETESKDSEGPRVLLVSLADGSVSTLYRGLAAPICWSEDERFVYLITDRPSPENLGSGEPGSLNVSPRPGTVVPDDARATPSPRYQSSESPRAQILAVPLDGGPPRTLASLSHRGGMWSAVDMTPDGRWLVYDADDFVSDVWLVEPLPGTTP
ncbi:MAG: hypothetical protein R3E12_11155 [Candidatus Eisenbacteria bacterium]